MEELKTIFERAGSFKPNREINVLFSGGEATLSPIFLDAVRHAKSKGFHRLHVATNGIRFAQEKDFAVNAKAAGLHAVYLQFDGVTEEKNRHRGIGNYMEVKRRALDNLCDVLHPEAALGSLFCDIHPNQGIFSPILINSRTREIVPVAKFFDVLQFLHDVLDITDLGRGPAITKAMVALSAVRNFHR